MNRREVLSAVGLGLVMVLTGPAQGIGLATPKEATVTLEIRGMVWTGCAEEVQSALESVKGVKKAKVSFDDPEAVVTYDPDVVKVEDLIKAVKGAPGIQHFDAKVKKKDVNEKPSRKDRSWPVQVANLGGRAGLVKLSAEEADDR